MRIRINDSGRILAVKHNVSFRPVNRQLNAWDLLLDDMIQDISADPDFYRVVEIQRKITVDETGSLQFFATIMPI